MILEQPLRLAIDILNTQFHDCNPSTTFHNYQYVHVVEFRRKYFLSYDLSVTLTTYYLFSETIVIPKDEYVLKSYINYIRTGDIVFHSSTAPAESAGLVVNNVKVFKMVKVVV